MNASESNIHILKKTLFINTQKTYKTKFLTNPTNLYSYYNGATLHPVKQQKKSLITTNAVICVKAHTIECMYVVSGGLINFMPLALLLKRIQNYFRYNF